MSRSGSGSWSIAHQRCWTADDPVAFRIGAQENADSAVEDSLMVCLNVLVLKVVIDKTVKRDGELVSMGDYSTKLKTTIVPLESIKTHCWTELLMW